MFLAGTLTENLLGAGRKEFRRKWKVVRVFLYPALSLCTTGCHHMLLTQ